MKTYLQSLDTIAWSLVFLAGAAVVGIVATEPDAVVERPAAPGPALHALPERVRYARQLVEPRGWVACPSPSKTGAGMLHPSNEHA